MVKTIAFILLRLIATLLAVTFLTFAMVALLPGDRRRHDLGDRSSRTRRWKNRSVRT